MSILNHLSAATVQLYNLSKRFEVSSFNACASEDHLGVIIDSYDDYNELLISRNCNWSSSSKLGDGSGWIYRLRTNEYPLLEIICVVYGKEVRSNE